MMMWLWPPPRPTAANVGAAVTRTIVTIMRATTNNRKIRFNALHERAGVGSIHQVTEKGSSRKL